MPKKIPMRQCLGCREMKPKRELIRVVRSPEGEISLDFRGKKPGRGAYVCPDPECLKRSGRAGPWSGPSAPSCLPRSTMRWKHRWSGAMSDVLQLMGLACGPGPGGR